MSDWLSGIPETEGFDDWMRSVVGRCGLVPLGPQESYERDEHHDGPPGEHPAEQQQSDMHWHRAPQTHPGSASTTENQYTDYSFGIDQQGDEQTLIRSNHGLPGVAEEDEAGRVCEVGVAPFRSQSR